MEYTKRRNLNRGYMKLEAWQRAMDLFVMAFRLADGVPDFKLKSQFRDAAQSVSANIGEGYGRRSLAEYLQYLYTAKGSMAETLTRAIGLKGVKLISDEEFENSTNSITKWKISSCVSLNRWRPNAAPMTGATRCHLINPIIHQSNNPPRCTF